MNNRIRTDIACAISAVCAASFSTNLWLTFSYAASRPRQPDPALGIVYPLNNHGSITYLSNSEATGMGLLMMAFFIGLLATVIIVPKEAILPRPGTPQWLTYVSARTRTPLGNRTPRLTTIFACSLVVWLAVIVFGGRAIADFAVSEGLSLSAW